VLPPSGPKPGASTNFATRAVQRKQAEHTLKHVDRLIVY
jgi:hypothetical protein